MTPFGPLQPIELVAILATLADVGSTAAGIRSGRAREANPIFGRGKKAAAISAVVAIALHFAVRTSLSVAPGEAQATCWTVIACLRGAAALWNLRILAKH